MNMEHFDTVVVGGDQAGLAMGYYLKKQGRSFVILDAGARVGDAWRNRWDALRLFTPAALSSLPGLPFPASGGYFATKDEMADYLRVYAETFALPVRLGRRVESLTRSGDGYLVRAEGEAYKAKRVVVATGPYHTPRIPDFADQLDPAITQLHSSTFRNPQRLPEGSVLVVGAGNSGAEIAVQLAATRIIYLSGRDTGSVPGDTSKPSLSKGALLAWRIGWWLLGRLTADTKRGQKGKEFSLRQGAPLIRLKPKDLEQAGVEGVPRTEGVKGGKPELADGRVLDVASVVWATGFRPDFNWIELSIFDPDGYPVHHRGVVDTAPGLYFLGLPFQYTFTSAVVGGVGRDARYLAEQISRETAQPAPAEALLQP